MTPSTARRAGGVRGRAALALLASLCALLASAAPARATGYRYWSFWDLGGDGWVYATQGPSLARPDDGSVQGFRFSVSEDSQDSAEPRGPRAFADICARTPAAAGSKRIALVIDFGTAADAPDGERPPAARTACARISRDGTSAEALAAVAKPLRYDSSALLCAVAGYPRTGCGEQVASRSASPRRDGRAPSSPRRGPSLGLVAGVVAVAVLGAAAVWQARRRRD